MEGRQLRDSPGGFPGVFHKGMHPGEACALSASVCMQQQAPMLVNAKGL